LEEKHKKLKKEEKGKNVVEEIQYKPKPPFPQRLNQTKREQQNVDIYEVFKQVRINIPLLDTIEQTP